MDNAFNTTCKSALQKVVDDGAVAGAVGIVSRSDGIAFSGAAGTRALGGTEPMTEDTLFAVFSLTKAITAVAVLQAVEEGLIELDAPAGRYVPALAERSVIEGFADDGSPQLRPATGAITTRMLLTHTAGFGYDFFSSTYKRLVDENHAVPVTAATSAALDLPLLFDPGERWLYGINMDWAGQVVEAVRGKPLGNVLAERVFAPLGLTDIGFTRTADQVSRTATMHQRNREGALVAMPDFALPSEPAIHMGGHGLYATPLALAAIHRMWLNGGRGDNGPILKPETVQLAFTDQLAAHQNVTRLTSSRRGATHDAEFFPGSATTWSATGLLMQEPAPTGRRAGAVGWAGLANLYDVVDPQAGVAMLFATQLLPFMDPAVAEGAVAFERAVYDALGEG